MAAGNDVGLAAVADRGKALVAAAAGGYMLPLEQLLDSGAPIDPEDSNLFTFCITKTTQEGGGVHSSLTALMGAAKGGHSDIVERLLLRTTPLASNHDY